LESKQKKEGGVGKGTFVLDTTLGLKIANEIRLIARDVKRHSGREGIRAAGDG